MTRIALACLLTSISLFGMDRWAAWVMETSPSFRAVVLSDWFTALALIGGLILSFAAAIALTGLMFLSPLSGRDGSEDR